MSFDTLKKIIDEIKDIGSVEMIQLSENGDCFLNKDIIKILRYIKKNTSKNTHIFTNFSNLNKEMADIIISENLVGGIGFNLDGLSKESLKITKGLDVDVVTTNLEYFVNKRNSSGSKIPIRGMVIPLRRYIRIINKNFNCLPAKLKDKTVGEINQICDENETAHYLFNLLSKEIDSLERPPVVGWAEKENTRKFEGEVSCPFLKRIVDEIFVAPNGDVYSCCFDYNCETVFDNTNKNSLMTIFNSEKRTRFIEKIRTEKNPCKDTISCQILED